MESKVVFITGSAKRLGAATARHLHKKGYRIVLHCHRSISDAQRLLSALNQARANSAALITGDICDMPTVANIAHEAQQAFGRIDVLVNNASAFYPTPVGSIDLSHWHELVGSNMQAPLFLSQALKKQLERNQGVVINMVDIHAERPLKDHTLYCMAKSALVTMTLGLANELAPNIRVNGVAPGAILWPETPKGVITTSDKQEVLAQIPLGRLGNEGDIAAAIQFLIEASYITGQILAVDGGRSISSTSPV